MKKLIVTLLGMCIFGCGTLYYDYLPESVIDISDPPLNEINTSYVGDNMLQQGRYSEYDAIYVSEKVKIGRYYQMLPGYYLKKEYSEKAEVYEPFEGEESGAFEREAKNIAQCVALMVYKDSGKVCAVTESSLNTNACTNTTVLERTKKPILSKNIFQQTLIYNGKVGNKINIAYREFFDDRSRPAFSNVVEYDLSESTTIGYKGARLEVIEATNEYIKYRVLSNFNNAEL